MSDKRFFSDPRHNEAKKISLRALLKKHSSLQCLTPLTELHTDPSWDIQRNAKDIQRNCLS